MIQLFLYGHGVLKRSKLFFRGGSRTVLRRGCTRLLLYFNTNKPRFFFFAEYLLKTSGHLGGGGGAPAHPLHPPLDPPLFLAFL